MAEPGRRDCLPVAGCSHTVVAVEAIAEDTVVMERHKFEDTEEAGCTARAFESVLAQAGQ